ncbi:ent-kaur-16-ene synthase, chloroplastic-like [Benincasa hispida]|uniref:ent-kaur-16-ene synthase, chloroplastic-like n=1 Tax=Benincasa hispida TaxID=102211 RepID=UPI001902B7D8|nr:ent-kaur-16-ene synthase, chloroplastic-like [Benincasa hispida]
MSLPRPANFTCFNSFSSGLNFIESNLDSATDEKQHSPIGFHIIFSSMIEYAKTLELNLPLPQSNMDALFRRRELKPNRSNSEGGQKPIWPVPDISEGIGKSQDWDMVMTFQRKNTSLFNSPFATAAAFMNLNNDNCLDYLHLPVQKFGSGNSFVITFSFPTPLSPFTCQLFGCNSFVGTEMQHLQKSYAYG